MSYLDRVFENVNEVVQIKNIVNFETGKLKINNVAITTSIGETVTASAAELNKLDDMTATKQELINACDTSANVEDVTAANVIAATESGMTFFLNSAAEFASTLPAPAPGLRFTFIVVAAPSGASYTIGTNAGANVIKGFVLPSDGAAGANDTDADTITFADGQAVAGDQVSVISDGTSWFAVGKCKVAAGITFSTT